MAQLRADFERQVRTCLANDANMALTEPQEVKQRMKELRKRAGNPPQRVVALALDDTPPRTFQSWENAEVETDRENYEKVAAYYTKELGQKVTANWILFGQDEAPPLPTPSMNGRPADDLDALRAQLDRIEAAQLGLARAVIALLGQMEMADAVRELDAALDAVSRSRVDTETAAAS